MAKRRAQIVRDRIGERFQVLVGCLEVRSPLRKLLVEAPDFILALSPVFHFDLQAVAG
jgi:hypothetical protein